MEVTLTAVKEGMQALPCVKALRWYTTLGGLRGAKNAYDYVKGGGQLSVPLKGGKVVDKEAVRQLGEYFECSIEEEPVEVPAKTLSRQSMQMKFERIWMLLSIVSDELHEIEELGGEVSEPLDKLWSEITSYLGWSEKSDSPFYKARKGG